MSDFKLGDVVRETEDEKWRRLVLQPDFKVTAHAEYAYNPRQGARSIGREHAILDVPLRLARFRRDTGDALCKPRKAFWGLSPGSTNEVSCPRCLQLAKRYLVVLPQEAGQ